MFTGIIATTGKILANQQSHLRIEPKEPWEDYKTGESIAINGACLTVEKFSDNWFECYVSPETQSVTTLKKLTVNSLVNLERALAAGDRFGGHFVSGHIDTLARIQTIRRVGSSQVFRFIFAQKFSKLVVPKGSICLDGISLTVNQCGNGFLEVNIIPATQAKTTISNWRIGYQANMETDLLGKYILKNTPFIKGGRGDS
jgi:riboflavin synthase